MFDVQSVQQKFRTCIMLGTHFPQSHLLLLLFECKALSDLGFGGSCNQKSEKPQLKYKLAYSSQVYSTGSEHSYRFPMS